MSIAPIMPFIVGNNGAWLAVRSSPAQGSCGVRSYPCKHPGVDVVGRAGTQVMAPEGGLVVQAADGSRAPFSGYGPWLVIIQGDSGKYHLLAHLDPGYMNLAPIGLRVKEGQVIGRTSGANHTHWEVRKQITPPSGGDNFTNNEDPIAWMSGGGTLILIALAAGAGLLYFLAKRHG